MSHRIVTVAPTRYCGRFRQLIRLAVLLFLTAVGGPVMAQGVAVASLSATIVTPLSVTATTDLRFGSVLQGVPKTVSRTAVGVDTSAAVFTVTGDANAGISIRFTLPEYMSNASGDRMVISFSATDGTIDSLPGTPDAPGGGAWTGVNPYSLPAAAIGGTTGNTAIYLGGKVTPAVQQAPGTYTGDIVISVTYDGT